MEKTVLMTMACLSSLQKSHELDFLSVCQAHLPRRLPSDLPLPWPHALTHADCSPGPWLPTTQGLSLSSFDNPLARSILGLQGHTVSQNVA